jgi:hypothetical protein
VALHDLDPARRTAPVHERSVLWEANTALARPIAALFGLLGFAPGQLSLQSLTVTVVGLLRMATGAWDHVVQGVLIVYAGLLLDRADHLLAEAKGKPPAWGIYLGLIVDRLVEVFLIVGLSVLLAVGLHRVPGPLSHAWNPLPSSWAVVLAVGTMAVMLLWRLAQTYADVLYLRTHLLVIRRLPGPSIIPRHSQGIDRLGRIFDRDLLVLAWLVGLVLAQLQLTLFVIFFAHLAAFAETIVLFWHRRRDPEPQASRILGRDYP